MAAADHAVTSLTGTPKWLPGHTFEVRGTFTIAATTETGDTATFSDALPALNFPVKVVGGSVEMDEADSNASPGDLTVGDGTDADGYLTASAMGSAANENVIYEFNGALIGETATSRDVVLTLGTVATGVAGATGVLTVRYFCG